MKRFLTVAALLYGFAAPAHAVTLVYNDFSTTAGLQLNGAAAPATTNTGRQVLRVAPSSFFQSGSAFSTSPVAFEPGYSFSTRFTFNFNTFKGSGADGLVFVIQPNSAGVGGSGGGIGYGGIGRSLGVEFDNFNNGAPDRGSGNHIGVDLNGSLNSLVVNTALPFLLDGSRDLTAWIDYNSATQGLEVRLNNSIARPATSLLSYTFDLAAIVGQPSAFVGFTSGTGGSAANHDIVNWEFRSFFAPIGIAAVPEPASWLFMILGFGLAGAAMRRKKVLARSRFASKPSII